MIQLRNRIGLFGMEGVVKKLALAACLAATALANGYTIVSQLPPNGGGAMRWSKLWVDLSGQGNNLDGDAICYEDFVLHQSARISHIEWWGDAPPDQGFQIEFWKQDPGTTGYQPLGVFRELGAQPDFAQIFTSYSSALDSTGTYHYTLDLPIPVALHANNAANPRWFIAIIGLTDVAYLEWNWAQGMGGSSRTFQFIRGAGGGGDRYWILPEGRAMVLKGVPMRPTVPPISIYPSH